MQEYKSNRDDLVLKSLSDPQYLQAASGIKADLDATDMDGDEIICFEDDA